VDCKTPAANAMPRILSKPTLNKKPQSQQQTHRKPIWQKPNHDAQLELVKQAIANIQK